MAEVIAQLEALNHAMVQMSLTLEEIRGRLEVGDADRVRLQQQLHQQDVGRMQELRDQAAAATVLAAAGYGNKVRLDMQGYHESFAHQLDVLVAGMKRAIRAVQSEWVTERGEVFEMAYLQEVMEHLKIEIQSGTVKMLELQDLVLAVRARADDCSPVSSSQGESLKSGDRTTAARSEQPQVYGVPTDFSVGIPQAGAFKEKTRMLMDSKSLSELRILDSVEAEHHFKTWVSKVKDYVESQFGEEFREALQWAAEQDDVINELDINKSYGETADYQADRIEDIMNKNSQLYTLLRFLTDQQGVEGTPHQLVIGSPWNNGFETWRMLHLQYYPSRRNHQKLQGGDKCFDSSSQRQELVDDTTISGDDAESGFGMSGQWHEGSKVGPQPSDKLNQEPKTNVCALTVPGSPSEALSSEHPISSDDEVACRTHGFSSRFWQPEGTDACMMCEPPRLNPQYDV